MTRPVFTAANCLDLDACTVAAELVAIASQLADSNDDLDLNEDTVFTTGAALGRAFAINADGKVALTTQQLRNVYGALLQFAHLAGLLGSDLVRMACNNAQDELGRDGGRRYDLDGNAKGIAYVKGLALAIAQSWRWEEAYEEAIEAWNENVAEIGMGLTVSGTNPADAALLAAEAAGPKPTRFWVHAAA